MLAAADPTNTFGKFDIALIALLNRLLSALNAPDNIPLCRMSSDSPSNISSCITQPTLILKFGVNALSGVDIVNSVADPLPARNSEKSNSHILHLNLIILSPLITLPFLSF